MSSYRPVPDPRVAAPRLVGALVAVALLLLGAACTSPSANDTAIEDGEASEESASSAASTILVALGPAVGPVGPPGDLDVTPPGLVVTSPVHNAQVNQASFVFEGFTEPGATVSAGTLSTVAEDSGRWSLELILAEGENTAVVTATDSFGNEYRKTVTVNFDKSKPPLAEPPKDKDKPEASPNPDKADKHHDFTAWTKFGICSTEPFAKTGGEGSKDSDVLTKFKGTGVPGTKVTVVSPYGGGTAEVDDAGYWWIKVEFADGAAEGNFTATVTSGDHVARFHCGAI